MAGSRTDPIEDARLVAEVVKGSEEAFAALYDRHAGAVYAAASRLTSDRLLAEDVVQETFLALWNRAEQFEPRLGSLSAWLLTIARNRTVDRLRAAGRRPTIVPIAAARVGEETEAMTLERVARVGEVVGGATMDRGPEDELAGSELRQVLGQALAAIPATERDVLLLAYRDQLTQTEIADRLGWPLGTVKTRTRRALLKLRETLGPELGPELGPVTLPDGSPLGEDPAAATERTVGAGS
jgi:RNA polymerase sigma-70 factor (ECF subfamily)